MVAQAGHGDIRGEHQGWRVSSPGTVPGASWLCAWGWGLGPPCHASASSSSTLPQWMKNRWRSWIQARGCRSSRWSRLSPRAGSAAMGAAWQGDTQGHPAVMWGDRGGCWGPVPPLQHRRAHVPCAHTHVPCLQGRAVPSCAVGSPTPACPARVRGGGSVSPWRCPRCPGCLAVLPCTLLT